MCNTSKWTEEPVLILWYRGESGVPIYTVDGRNSSSLQKAQQIPSSEYDGRAAFDPARHPPTLVIKALFREDDNEYRCRCDFRTSRTQNFLVNLTVIGMLSHSCFYARIPLSYTHHRICHLHLLKFRSEVASLGDEKREKGQL